VTAFANNGPIGRPHLADALIEGGFANDRDDAFDKFLKDDGPVYISKYRITPAEVFNLIHSIGGAAFLAHPGRDCADRIIRELHLSGLDGLEIVHPRHTDEVVERFRRLAGDLSLLTSGGSDFHGGKKEEETIGKYCVSVDAVDRIEEYCIEKRKDWYLDSDEGYEPED
jgi:hypothetical protein